MASVADGKRSLVLQSAVYTAGTFIVLLVSIGRTGIGARVLTPTEMGLWLGLQVVLGYVSNFHFGVVFGMFRSVPLLLVAGDRDGAREELRTSRTFVLGVALVLALMGIFFGHLILGQGRWLNLVLGSALACTTLIKAWYVTAYKAEKRFVELSSAGVIGAFCGLVGVAAIPKFGLSALLGGSVAQNFVETLALARNREATRIGIVWPVLRSQFRVGALTLISNFGVVALTSVERTVMLKGLGAAATGLFSIGAQISILVPLVAAVPLSVLTPVFVERAGKGLDLFPVLERANLIVSYTFSWAIAVGWVSLKPIIALVWPHLLPSVLACRLSLLGVFPYLLTNQVVNVFFAKDRQRPAVVITFFSAAAAFGLSWAGMRLTGTIAGASGGAAVGMYAYFFVLVVAALLVIDKKPSIIARFFVKTLAPLGYATGAVVLVTFATTRLGPETSPLRGAVAVLVLTLLMSPFLYRAYRLLRGRATLSGRAD